MDRQPPPCGTPEGYRWHYSHGEPRDQACKTAMNNYNRFRAGLPLVDRTPPPCGTSAAARRHRRRGERLDDACREVERLRNRARRSVPCACGCGEMVVLGQGSRPPGEAMRRECLVRVGRPNLPRTRPNRTYTRRGTTATTPSADAPTTPARP